MKKYTVPPIPNSVWKNPLHFIAFGFGSGAIPVAPGTFGTLLAIPLYLLFSLFSFPIYLLLTILFVIGSMWICHQVSKEINVHDHQGMNLDEFAGYLVTMIHAPKGFIWILIGFVLFRVFDILKPWPIGWVDEKISGGFGMVFDDVLAGIYACILIQIIARFA